MKNGLREFIFVSSIFVVLSLIFYFPIFLGEIPLNGSLLVTHWSPWEFIKWEKFPTGVPQKFVAIDEVREFFPLLDFNFDSLKAGVIPLWNPYNFSGYSHLANWASAVFYPLHIFMFLLGKTQMLILLKLSIIILSGIFTYYYLKTLKLNNISSFFGAMSFSFSATMTVWTAEIWQSTHAFLWLPLSLMSIEKIVQERENQFIAILAVSIALSIMAGYIQPTIYLLFVVFSYSLFRIICFEGKRKLLNLAKIGSGLFLGIILSSVHLLPGVEGYLLSPRSQVQLKDLNVSFLLMPMQAVAFFVPDFFGNIATNNWWLRRVGQYYENMSYVGIVSLVVVPLSFLLSKYRKYFLFFLGWSIISLTLIFDSPVSRLVYNAHVPFLSSAIPIRIVFILSFSMSLLSAFGIEWWLKENNIKKTSILLIPLILVFSSIGVYIFQVISQDIKIDGFPDNWYMISARNFLIPLFFVLSTCFLIGFGQIIPKIKKAVAVILLCSIFASSFLFAQKYFAFSPQEFIYPSASLIEFIQKNQGYNRYFGYGSASIANNFATVYKIYSPEGYDPVNISHYNELMSSSRFGKYESFFSRSDALLYPVVEFPLKDVNSTRYRIMDFLGVKYIGFEKEELKKIEQRRLDPNRYLKVWDKDNFLIYENKKVLPRVFTAQDYVIKNTKVDAIETLYDPRFDIRNSVILEEKPSIDLTKGEGRTEIVEYSQNKVVVKAVSNGNKLLVLSDVFYPGWTATVNGIPTKITKANYAFRAVPIPSGESRIEFIYRPLSFQLGITASIISLLTLGFIILYNNKRKYGSKI